MTIGCPPTERKKLERTSLEEEFNVVLAHEGHSLLYCILCHFRGMWE
jgi:hypothetical protein